MNRIVLQKSLVLPITVKAVYGFIYSLFWIFVPIFLSEQGYSGFHIGLFLGLSSLMAIITTIPAGIANDRVHSKKMILYALIFSILYYAGLLTVTNTIILSGVFILGGLGRNIFNVSIDSLAYRMLDESRSSSQLGKYVAFVVFAEIIGFIIGGNIIEHFGFEKTITAIIVLLGITTLITFFLPITHTFKFKLLEYKKDIFRKEVLLFILIVFLFTLHYGAEGTSYSLFLKNRFLFETGNIGLFVGGAVVFLSISSLYFSRKISNGFNPKHVFYIGLVVSGLGHILFSLQAEVAWAFIFRCVHEFGDGAMILSIFYGIIRIFNIERIGGNSSMITFTSILGGSVGAFIFGPLGEAYGYYLPLFISGITTVSAFALLYYLDKRALQKA